MLTNATGDYLKAIFDLESQGGWVAPSSLSQRLGVSAPSVTGMTQRLAAHGYASYVPYQGVRLTPKGRAAALELLRHHRLLELYLQRALGYPWDRVHDEAEKLEHTISEEFEDRIDAALGHPTEDPHGHPIPPKSGEFREDPAQSLWSTAVPGTVRVLSVSDRDPEVLRYLAEMGVRPGVDLTVSGRAPFDGPVTIRMNDREHVLGQHVAQLVFVLPITPILPADGPRAEEFA